MFKIMTSTVVVGGFFGDEGKGKIISYLAITYKKLKNNTKGISLLMIFGKFNNEKFR